MIKAYSYIRFSSFRQAAGDSVRRQLELVQAYAEKSELQLQDLSLADMGVSAFHGDNKDNGSLGEFIRLVKAGDIPRGSYLLIESFDRLSRQAVEIALGQFLELINLGIVIVTLVDEQVYRAGELDLSKLTLSIVYMSRANEESEMKSRRTKAVWEIRKAQARQDGKFITNSNYPRWLKREGNDLAVIPEHAVTVLQVFNWSKDGMGYQKIAQMLNDGESYTFQGGKPWKGGHIHSILRNRAVMGEYQPHIKIDGKRTAEGDPIKNYYPKIIEPSLFLLVQSAIDSRNKRGAGYRKGHFSNLFMGLMRCSCGAAVILGSQHKNGSSYLKCPQLSCTGTIRYQYAEPQMLIALSHVGSVIRRYQAPDNSNELAEVLMEIEAKQAKLAELAKLVADNPVRTLVSTMSNMESEIDELAQKRDELEIAVEARLAQTVTLLNLEKLDTPEDRASFNAKLRLLIDEIVVLDQEGHKTLVYNVNGRAVLEQQLKSKSRGLTSKVYDIDGTLVLETKSDAPHIVELEVITEPEPYEPIPTA
jgi:DNA invertase Pin-like site-specific DNA recombinase